MSILTRDIWEAGGENVATKSEVIWAQLARRFEAGMNAYAPGLFGQSAQQLAGVRNMVREVFGVDTGDTVAKAARRRLEERHEGSGGPRHRRRPAPAGQR